MKSLKMLAVMSAVSLFSVIASAQLSSNQAALLFNNVELGQQSTLTFQVTNIGQKVITNIETLINGNQEYEVVTSLPGSLFPGERFLVGVKLQPEHYGAKKRKLIISGQEVEEDSSLSDIPPVVVDLIGRSDNPNGN